MRESCTVFPLTFAPAPKQNYDVCTVRAKLKTYKACTLCQLQCVTQYLYASGDSPIGWPHTELVVWLFLQKKGLSRGSVRTECLECFPSC